MPDHRLHRYEVLHNKLSGLEVLPVDCNPVEIQSVFHNPLVELAVYRHSIDRACSYRSFLERSGRWCRHCLFGEGGSKSDAGTYAGETEQVWCGTFRKSSFGPRFKRNRLEPAHALSTCGHFSAGTVPQLECCSVDEARARENPHVFPAEGEKGWYIESR